MTGRLGERRGGPSVSEPDGGVGVGAAARASDEEWLQGNPMNWVSERAQRRFLGVLAILLGGAKGTRRVLALNENDGVRYDEQCTCLLV